MFTSESLQINHQLGSLLPIYLGVPCYDSALLPDSSSLLMHDIKDLDPCLNTKLISFHVQLNTHNLKVIFM